MASSQNQPTAEHFEQACRWVGLLHDGEISPDREREFQAWLASHPAHRQAYQEAEAFWRQLGETEHLLQPELGAARVRFKEMQAERGLISENTGTSPLNPRKPAKDSPNTLLPIKEHHEGNQSLVEGRIPSCLSHRKRPLLALAASVLVAVAVLPLARIAWDNGTYRTIKGEQRHLELSDGTAIDLNTATKLRVAYTLSERKVELIQGEALFNVQHDATKPFAVNAGTGVIRDIGTQFNVYRHGDDVQVAVLEGEVSIQTNGQEKEKMLRAGMQSAYNPAGQIQSAEGDNIRDAVAWRDKRMVFKGKRLDFVLAQLSRYHAVELTISQPKLAALNVSGSFPTDNLDVAINTIAASLPLKVKKSGTKAVSFSMLSKTGQ